MNSLTNDELKIVTLPITEMNTQDILEATQKLSKTALSLGVPALNIL